MPIKIFFCYARKDRVFRDSLERHLEPWRRSGQIITWHDREILPGTKWKREIDVHLQTSDIILLLVSPNFMASDYCYGVEMRQALERHKAGEAHVIPIILHPVHWQETPLSDLQALPTDAKPVSTWPNHDEAYLDIAAGIAKVVKTLLTKTHLDGERDGTQSHCSPTEVIKHTQVDTGKKLSGRQEKQILVVDDEPSVQSILRRDLMLSGYDVLLADSGKQALELLHLHQPDLVLLDMLMPGDLNGLDVCMKIRETSRVPIIVVSAVNNVRQKVRALELGADDYLTKPFSRDELQARIRVCLRRTTAMEIAVAREPEMLSSGDGYLCMDVEQRQVYAGAQKVRLTPTEFELLRQLMLSVGKVLTFRALLRAVWGPEYGEEADYLRVYIRQLRRKIEEDPSKPRYIVTEPGIGYMFSPSLKHDK